MKKYIKITNQSQFVNRLSLEKLGLSTKRNDPGTIGQFGSGIKYAPIAALRMGLEWVFTGNDEIGPYTLSYIVKNESGINSIYYEYGKDDLKTSSFTLEAGMLSWEDEFQIYREAISNAKDGGNWSRSIVNKIEKPVNNEFSVYISASPKMMDIYNNHEIYFCDDHNVLFKIDKVSVLKNNMADSNPLRIYCKSVLVDTNKDVKNHLYNYEVNDIVLNEDRQVKSQISAQYSIANAIIKINNNEMIDKMLDCVLVKQQKPWEFFGIYESAYNYSNPSSAWAEVFFNKFKENAVLLSPEQSMIPNIDSIIKMRGKNPVKCISPQLYSILSQAKVALAHQVLDEDFQYDLDYDLSKYPKLQKAISICEQYEPKLTLMKKSISVFKSQTTDTLGMTLGIDKSIEKRQIIIDKSHAENSNIYELIATVLHEYDHYSTGIPDSLYREFRNLADSRIGRLVYDLYKTNLITVNDQGFWIPIEKLSELTSLEYKIEKTNFEGFLLQIGSLKFFINDSANCMDVYQNNMSGQLVASKDGKSMGIHIKLIKDNIKITKI
jgi:hypothetical protein